MAHRGGAAPFVAITLLFLTSLAFFFLWYQRETDIQTREQDLRTANTTKLIETWGNPSVSSLIKEKIGVEKRASELQAQFDQAGKDKTLMQAKLQEMQDTATRLQGEKETLAQRLSLEEGRSANLQRQVQEVQQRKESRLLEEINRLKNIYAQETARSEQLTRGLKRSEEREQALRAAYQKRIMDLQRQNSGLQDVIGKWQKETGRREQIREEEYDGRVVEVDVSNKFLVINLGRAHRVHRGMRFDVIRWRLNKWDYMGAIEITEVNPTTSNCVILDAIVQQKVCPLTGYIAADPEMKYSPYAATADSRAIELVQSSLEEKQSMKAMDPIVIGDYITNPFFSKERQLKFVVAGDSVEYSPEEIRKMIVQYGGEVQDMVDVDTDYLVLGRIPDENAIVESEEAQAMRARTLQARDTAHEYGIPIMREVELFSFLRN